MTAKGTDFGQRRSIPIDAPTSSDLIDLGQDLMIGAETIAQWLNAGRSREWTRRRIYHMAEIGEFPIHKVKGLGICARKSALRAYFAKLDEPYLTRLPD